MRARAAVEHCWRNSRQRKIFAMTAWGTLTLIAVLGSVWQAQAQDAKASYSSMASLDQYLMTDRNAEIALARSAAPEAISREATILVLARHGYETGVEGKNGWVCVVERSWMSPFDNQEFWNPKLRGPICFNPPAARTVLPITYKRTEMVLAGLSKARITDNTKAAYDKHELPALESGAMSYMMSKDAYLTDSDGHNMSHLMFYASLMDGAAWGADLPGSPVMLNLQFHGAPEPITVFMVAVGKWSDGTAAPME
jgi:hypothetical protein